MANRKKQHQKQAKKKNNLIWIFAAVVVLGVIAALIATSQTGQASSSVTVKKASELFAEGAYLLDVREPEEWNEAHVDGAVLIPLEELPGRVDELPTDRDILIICRSGNRSAEARDFLRQAGIMNTISVSGGLNAWKAAGLPVVKGP